MDQQGNDAPDPAAILQQGLEGVAGMARTVLSAAREAATAGLEAGRDALADAGATAPADVPTPAEPVMDAAAEVMEDVTAPVSDAADIVVDTVDAEPISELADPPGAPMLDAGDQPAGELPSGESSPAGVVGDDDAVGTSMPPLEDPTA